MRNCRRGAGGWSAPAVAVCIFLFSSMGLTGCSDGAGERAESREAPNGTVAAATSSPVTQAPPDPPPSDTAESLGATLSDCPSGFREAAPGPGSHEGFTSAGQVRSFHLLLPGAPAPPGPRPLLVALTGTVQPERAFLEQSRLDELTEQGWIVVAPVRNSNGLIWPPWDALRTPEQQGLANADLTFIEDLVHCVAAHHPVDATRIFVAGISIGGSMTNLVLRSLSDLFAGGIVGSGTFALTEPERPMALDDMVVIVAWGGDGDRWIGCPDGRMGPQYADEPGCVDAEFVTAAGQASQFYASEPNVELVACSADVGHRWIAEATPYMAEILLNHPKGSGGGVLLPPDPPSGLTCRTEASAG